VKALAGTVGGGAIAFTLMACYGGPPCGGAECRAFDDGGTETESDAGRDVNRPDVRVNDAGKDSAIDGGGAGPADASTNDADAG
jgi:hypothetical protein